MNHHSPTDHRVDQRVVVVGAGPAGLVTAIMLARRGIDVLVLERRHHLSPLPRAVGITLRQMELFRSWGLEERLRAGADDVDLALLVTTTAADAHAGERRDLNVPTRVQSAVVSPTAPARVPQDHLEHVLMEYLQSLPSAEVRRGVEVTAVSQDEDAVHLQARETATGAITGVSAHYLVAADGARSVVRSELAIPFTGPEDMMVGISAEFRADLWPVLAEHRYALYTITEPAGAGVLIPAGQGDRWQFGVVLRDGDDAAALAEPEALRRRIQAASGVADLPVEITRVHRFRSGAQLADRFLVGRVALVGDAAHRVTPRGGNGLAMAVRDGMDLGWRLAWVLSGWAPGSFLNTYETECREVVADSVARAADPQGYCREVISEMLLDLGGRLQHAWVAPGVSTLDLLGPGLTLFVSADGDGWSAAARRWRQAIPLSVIPVPPLTAQALGLHRSGGAMLVRPDGVSVATWWSSSEEAADLERAYLALVGSGYSPALTPSAPHLSQFPLQANPQEATRHAYARSV